jgi:hypothetical protein
LNSADEIHFKDNWGRGGKKRVSLPGRDLSLSEKMDKKL